MAIETNTNPQYKLCVQIQPHTIDTFMTTHGAWGVCDEVRDWILLLHFVFLRAGARDVRLAFADVGANIGTCSLLIALLGASQWGDLSGTATFANFPLELADLPSVDVVAVEPDPVHAAMLRASCALNGAQNAVRIHEQAAWHAPARALELRRFEFLNSGMSYVSPDSQDLLPKRGAGPRGMQAHEIGLADSFPKRTIRVPAGTLDDMLSAEVSSGRVIVMKVDIEGQEMRAIYGARELLAADRIALMHFEFATTLRRDGIDPADFLRFLLLNRFYLLCMGECAHLFPGFAGRPILEPDVDAFLALQIDWAIDLVALHQSYLPPSLVDKLPDMLRSISNAFAMRSLVRRSQPASADGMT